MEDLRRFEGKKFLLTGGGTGIGRGIAIRMASEGADVAIHDFNKEAAEATAKMIRDKGGKAWVYQVDVSKVDDVRKAIDATMDYFGGRIDYLAANAGIGYFKKILDFTQEDWERIIGVNLTGVWNYDRYVGEIMAKQGGGAIVNTSSVGSFTASHMRAIYMASKGGVKMLTQALAQDFGEFNVRVNAVAPGVIESELTRPDEDRPGVFSKDLMYSISALHRMGHAEDIAAGVAFLLSSDASFITGTTLVIDGGMTAGNMVGLPLRYMPKPGYEVPYLDGFDFVKEYKEFLASKK